MNFDKNYLFSEDLTCDFAKLNLTLKYHMVKQHTNQIQKVKLRSIDKIKLPKLIEQTNESIDKILNNEFKMPFNMGINNFTGIKNSSPESLRKKLLFNNKLTTFKNKSMNEQEISKITRKRNSTIVESSKYSTKIKNHQLSDEKIEEQKFKVYMSNVFKNNHEFIKKYSKNNFKNIAFYDQKFDNMKNCNKQSIYLYLCQNFHPMISNNIINLLKMNKMMTYEIFLTNVILSFSKMKYSDILLMSYNIYNINNIGNIDCNDLILILKSIYCTSNKAEYILHDLFKMIGALETKAVFEQDKKIENRHQLFKYLENDFKHAKYTYIKQVIDNKVCHLEDKINSLLNNTSYQARNLTYHDFVSIEWEKIPNHDFRFPKIFIKLFQLLTGIDLSAKLIKNAKKLLNDSMYTTNLHLSYHEFIDFCTFLSFPQINPNLVEPILNYSSFTNYKQTCEQFYLMVDKNSNRITKSSLFEYLSIEIGLNGTQRLSDRLYELMSNIPYQMIDLNDHNIINENKVNYPINLFKYFNFIQSYNNTGCRFMFEIMDINLDGTIGLYEIEFFKEVFFYYPNARLDFERLEEALLVHHQNNVETYEQFFTYLYCVSHTQNMLWLLFQGDKDWKEYGVNKMFDADRKYIIINDKFKYYETNLM